MKKNIIGWTGLVAIAAVTGIGIFLAGSHESAMPSKLSAPGTASESAPSATERTRGGTMQPIARVQEDMPVGFGVLAERQVMLDNGDVEQRQLVRRTGRYPDRIVIDTLRRDRDLGRFVSVGTTEMVADHVLVSLQDDAAVSALETVAASFDAEVLRPLSDERTFLIRLQAPGLDAVDEAVSYFSEAVATVAYAEPDYVRHLSMVPNDPSYGDLWGMAKISMPDAWDLETGSRQTVVAVIDTGMDMDHPDLIDNLWINAIEIPGDGVDNDGNGYVDDLNGWDFISEDDDPEDGDGHGTHCAGTIGAVGNNANQLAGICWEVSLMPLRVGTGQGLLDSDIVDGIRYAARNGARVLSNSYGGPGFSQTVYDAVEYANAQGCIFVAAAGNDGTNNDLLPQYPASYELPNVISVAATDENDALASFSNYGASSVDLAAPGVNIVSTYLNGGIETLEGTSMACPHVAGAMALLVSLNDTVSPVEAKQLAMDSVDQVAALAGKVVSGGRLNVFALFASANDTDKDGIPDTWEERYGLDPNDPSDAALDGDGDFLTNLQEFKNACLPDNEDSDGDSLIDGWEVQYGFNPRDVMGSLPKLQYLGFNSQCLDTYDLVVTNGYAYVADGQYGLKILSLVHPENPQLTGACATAGSARGVAVRGNYAYVADQESGLIIIDISIPSDPVIVASLETSAMKVDVAGNYAYVAAFTNGLQIASIADPSNPVWTGQFITAGLEVYDVKVDGTAAYIGVDGAMARINVGNPASPQLLKNIHINGNDGAGVEVVDGAVLAALKPFGVVAYDAALDGIGEYATPGEAEDVSYFDDLIYVADGTKGLRILNAHDFEDIQPHASYENVQAYGVTVADGYAYVAGKDRGLHIFRSSIDSDGDGMYDSWEILHFGNLDQSYTNDYDADGIINWGEYLARLDPGNADQDGDGLVDGDQEVRIYLTDPRTSDTDADGLSDHYEVTSDGIGNLYLTDPIAADTDGDGMTDKWEIDHGLNPLVHDSAGDPDGDGATNLEEEQAGTDPSNPDTDGDGISDGWEMDRGLDPLFNDAAEDPDGDTLTNLQEYNYDTDPLKADSDDDGLTDAQEISINGTDPNLADTDGDGMPDGWEVAHSLNPLSNDAVGDLDSDGLSNYEEYLNGSDPYSADTDNDGFADDWERDWGTMATNAADPLVVDDDGPYDWWQFGGQPQDPQQSDPDENGSIDHPFDAIQEAINVAGDGYTILVREGAYYGFGNRSINPAGLQLRILAENQADPAATVVKSHGLGPVFVFDGGQRHDTVLAGFTIQSSMLGIDCSNGDCGEEHGIICRDASSPMITNCVVELCRADALYCDFNSNPTLIDVTIRTIYEGDGIHAVNGSTPTLVNCLITDIFEGSGIYAESSIGLAVTNTVIANCDNALGTGRGIWLLNDAGASIYNTTIVDCQGGIRCDNSSPLIDRCTIINNGAPDYYTVNGAGFMANTNIALWAYDIENDAVDEVHEEENGGGILLMSGSFPTIQNSVIANNRTWASDPEYSAGDSAKPYYGLGGGIYAGADCSTRLINCTMADNIAMTLGGGMTTYGNYVEFLRNDIIWNNSCNAAWLDTGESNAVFHLPGNVYFNSLHCNEGTSHFDPWYCDISDGFGFTTDRYNFESDPMFAGVGNYHLTAASACVDAGTYYSAPLYDRDGVQRPLDGDANPATYYSMDIGAYEYVNPLADTDGDGTLDVEEIAIGTDPTTVAAALLDFLSRYGLFSMDADSDADGMSNLDEYLTGTNPTDADTDGDLSPDGAELIAGTIATDPTSYFYVSDIRLLSGGGCELVFDSVPGRYYSVYFCTQIGAAWQVLVTDVPGDGSPLAIADTDNEGSRFYRVEVRN